MNPDTLTAQSLLNCLVREVSLPEEQAWESDGRLIVRLARSDRLLRLGTRRRSAGPSPRLTGEAELFRDDAWHPAGWAELALLIADELTLATGVRNDEFAAQVRASHEAIAAIMRTRKDNAIAQPPAPPAANGAGTDDGGTGHWGTGDGSAVGGRTSDRGTAGRLSGGAGTGDRGTGDQGTGIEGTGDRGTGGVDTRNWGTGDQGTGDVGTDHEDGTSGEPRIARYLASEQALVAGHRFHPASKARSGDPRGWLSFAPEAGARFPLRFLGVRDEAFDADGDTAALDGLGAPAAPPGYRVLPAHPWQLRLLAERLWLRRALRDKSLIDLGDGPRAVVPTSSVRTVYDPAADVFCKFSLNVRITNCVRKNSWYELASSVALTSLLAPVTADLAARFPGAAVLGEPGYRTVALPHLEAAESLAVIAREGLGGHLAPGVTPLLAAALTEPALGTSAGLFDDRDPDWLLGWWAAYVRQVAPPVLHALFSHGLVFEPHLQNVLVGLDADGLPVQAILRDLEGVKLVASRHQETLAALKPEVASALAYDAERGWQRVAYCLFVNHLAEVAAAIADRHPRADERFEAALWECGRQVLTEYARAHDWPPQLRAVLAGVPLPAKANLRLRWARAADRDAGYLTVRNPWGGMATTIAALTRKDPSC